MEPIQFIDLKAQQAHIGVDKINSKINDILGHGRYIMGPEITELEEKLSAFAGTKHTLSCSNGSDAILLALLALEIGPGDAVFVPSFTFAATGEMVALSGATPVFVDVLPDTMNMDPENLKQAIKEVKEKGEFTPKAVMPVCLFGQIANYPDLCPIAKDAGLKVIADAAQGFGSTINNTQAGEYVDVLTTSFFPAKPLGCYGDGGAVLTNDDEIYNTLISLRNHGQGVDKYDNVRIGINGRLDSIQAAILLLKLEIFPEEIESRNEIAARYSQGLKDVVEVPFVPENIISTWAQYTIQTSKRDAIADHLREKNIPTAIYYVKPMHSQTVYAKFPIAGGKLPVTDDLSHNVISLPMHPYLKPDVQDRIIEEVKAVL
ncbi:MAG: DegT/DnrJ/EryC1/StrS aminotransferase family protein [Rhizobiales bacterium]|nr:DegT/DnrJ/EryC1/StrS aminotransferase family protein [Hyphomicrobiales bacterium]